MESPEMFVAGDTHIYLFSSFPEESRELLEKFMKESGGKPVYLPCGVYAGHDRAPPIDVIVLGTLRSQHTTIMNYYYKL